MNYETVPHGFNFDKENQVKKKKEKICKTQFCNRRLGAMQYLLYNRAGAESFLEPKKVKTPAVTSRQKS